MLRRRQLPRGAETLLLDAVALRCRQHFRYLRTHCERQGFTVLSDFHRRFVEGAEVPLHVQGPSNRPEPGEGDAAEGGGAHVLQELVLETQSFGRSSRTMGLLDRMVALLGVLRTWNSDQEQIVRQCLLRRSLHNGGKL